jgi:hypothetical protein
MDSCSEAISSAVKCDSPHAFMDNDPVELVRTVNPRVCDMVAERDADLMKVLLRLGRAHDGTAPTALATSHE